MTYDRYQHQSCIIKRTWDVGRGRDPSGDGPTYPHRRDPGVSRWRFFGLPDGHEKQRKQVEYIRHRCVQPVVVRLLVISDFVELRDCGFQPEVGGRWFISLTSARRQDLV